MTASPRNAIIEAYVDDVVRRLPRRQRRDVGVELRSLLSEELRGRAGDEGRLPDEAMALDLVRNFGRPDDVAARYHPPGVAIIPPGQTAAFGWTALVGVLLQWAVSLPAALQAGGLERIGAWWIGYGLGAFWWPGFLIMMMLAAALVRQRWPAQDAPWRPAPIHRDEVSRPLYAFGILAALAGIAIWVFVAWFQAVSDSGFARALRFDPAFFAIRAPALVLYWGSSLVLMAIVLVEGRWRSLTRQAQLASNLAGCALMVWFLFAGPIFVNEAADRPVKFTLAVIAAAMLLSLAWQAWRRRRPYALPKSAARG
jgi:hypothetical protein